MRTRLCTLPAAVLLLALLAATVATAGAPGVTTRVSVSSSGVQGNDISIARTLSADGRYVAFSSAATNLVTGDTNGWADIFVRDRTTGQTLRISVASDGTQGNNASDYAALSADGRYVAFESAANNLVSGDTNGQQDIFVRDTVANTTTRVSVASDGTQANNGSDLTAISADGRYVAFDSGASNLVSGDTNGQADVFVRDRVANTTTRVSVASDGSQGNGASAHPALSADGRYVAFESAASNLVSGDTNGQQDIFVRDLVANTTTRVSVASDGTQGNGNSGDSTISADGRYVAFASAASNLVSGDTNGRGGVFVRDLVANTTTRVSVASDGTQGNDNDGFSAISADGRYVTFNSYATNLVVGDTNGRPDVFVRDLLTGVTSRVSVASDGTQGNELSWDPTISADGRYVAFWSYASNLVPNDTNSTWDVFVRDRCPAGNCAAFHRTHSQPDFDATNKADLLWRHATTGQDAVWLMNGVTPLSMGLTTPVTDLAWKIVGVGDLDGDAKTDLVWRNSTSGQMVAWFMNGASVTSYVYLPTVADPTWKLAAVADLNQDNKADLIWRNTSSGQNAAWLMDGAAVTSYPALPSVTDLAWTIVGVGDLNGDEMADLVWRNTSTGQNVAWLMDGAAVASYVFLPTVSDTTWTLVGVGDLNADYDADLVWHNTSSGQNVAWLMRGGNAVSYPFLPTVADQNWKLVAVSDLDGNGKADLVWRNFANGTNNAWLMDGATVLSYNALPSVTDLNWRVVSPASLLAAFNGLLPGPTEIGATKVDVNAPMASEASKDAKPMWSAAPKDAKTFWSNAPKDAKPMWSAAPKEMQPFWRDAPKDAPPMGLPR